MIIDSARVINVIIVEKGDEVEYFTLQGVRIGSFSGGSRVTIDKEPNAPQEVGARPKASVIKSKTPEEVKIEEAKHNEAFKSTQDKLDTAVNKNLVR